MKKEIGLYVHIPFCESKCFYCNFVSVKANDEDKNNYILNLLKEIELYKNEDYILKSIFIGGGTPSCLPVGYISKIINKIKKVFVLKKDCEITIEANPNSFNEEKAQEYKKNGINRISFGLQSANNRLLKSINRIHTKKDFINAISIARKAGFENINADMLIGLAGQRFLDVKKTLKLLVKLNVQHISCYSLILEEDTPLYALVKSKKYKLIDEDKVIKMFDFCNKYLQKHNIFRYEVSNFAKKGYECKHNLIYWNNEDYLGVGLNSHSKIDNTRFENFFDFENYYKQLKNNKKPIKNFQKLSLLESKEEFIMLGLRKVEGIDLKKYQELFGENLEKLKSNEIEKLQNFGFIKIQDDFLFATDIGFKVLNQIIVELV